MDREVVFDTDVQATLILGRDENVSVVLMGKRADVVVQLPPILPPTMNRMIVVREGVDMARKIRVRTGDYGADALRVVEVMSGSGTETCEVFLFDKGYWQHRGET
jgi:hypothetical protein